jgi:hypothetical protein
LTLGSSTSRLILALLLAGAAGCETADLAGAPHCRAAYRRARTAADTAVVDRQQTGAHASISCGTLRTTGKLS